MSAPLAATDCLPRSESGLRSEFLGSISLGAPLWHTNHLHLVMGVGMAAHLSSPQREPFREEGGGMCCLAHLPMAASQVSDRPEHPRSLRGAPGSLCLPLDSLLPGSPRAWSEDTEVNTEVHSAPQKHCQPPGVLKLPGSSHLSGQLHLEKVLITPCSKPHMPWQVIKHPTLVFKRGGTLLIHTVHLILLHKHTSLLEPQSLSQIATVTSF